MYVCMYVCIGPEGRGCRIHRLLLCRGIAHSPTSVLWYDSKQSDGEALVMLELWKMCSTPLLLPGPNWRGVLAPERVLSMGPIELKCVLKLKWIVWNRIILSFNCVKTKTKYLCWTELFEKKLLICIKMDLALNIIQCLICHKTKPNLSIYLFIYLSQS